MMKKGFIIRLLESFLCAGSSALLISAVHLYPEFWFVSLFALIPFLWRVISPDIRKRQVGQEPCAPDKKQMTSVRTTRVLTCMVSKPRGFRPTSAVMPGMILATCYVLVAYPAELYTSPGAFLLKLFALNVIFSLYGIAVNRLKKHVGFNVIFIAVLWLPLEYALSHYAGLGNLFALSTGESSLLLGSLFGLLMISFVIVLINSLILIILRQVAQVLLSRGTLSIPDDKRPYSLFKEIILERRWYYFPDVRAPPIAYPA